MASLYARLGEEVAIGALSEILYDRIYADGDLVRFFEGRDKQAMIKKQHDFLV